MVMEDAHVHALNFLERVRRREENNERVARELRSRLLAALGELGPGLGLTRALLFGSLAWGGFATDRSDVDIVVFGLDVAAEIQLTTALWERLDRPVHVVRAESAAPGLLERVQRDGVELRVA